MKKPIISIIAAISVFAAFSACQKEQQQAEVTPRQEVKEGTYTLTVQASKDPSTKALDLVDGVFTATWADGETVTVYNTTKGEALDGTLSPQSFGDATTFLSGSLTGTIEPNDWLELWFYGDPANGHKGQDGSLANLGDHEISKASLQVESISNGVITPKAAVVFDNQQSIVKFTLKNGDAAISANTVTIWAESKQLDGAANDAVDGELKITPGGESVIYVSLQNKSMAADTYAIIATDTGGNKYVCRQSGALFEYGKYYEITLKMTEQSDSYVVAGTEATFGSNFNTTDENNKLELQPSGLLYTKTYSQIAAASDLRFKVVKNGSWDTAYPAADFEHPTVAVGDLTIIFNPANNEVSILWEQSTTSYTVVGEPSSVFTTQWSQIETANDMTLNNGIYEKTYTISNAADCYFRIVKDHSWYTAEYPSFNSQFKFPHPGLLTITFDPSTEYVNAVGTTTTTYTVAGTSSNSELLSDWSATNTANDMTLKYDGSYYKVFSGVTKDTTFEFKVCKNHSWDTAYPEGNKSWTATQNCDIWIYINPSDNNFVSVTEVTE